MTRAENWPVLLDAWVDAHRARAFEWGSWDCCSAAADWVRTCTRVDMLALYFARLTPPAPVESPAGDAPSPFPPGFALPPAPVPAPVPTPAEPEPSGEDYASAIEAARVIARAGGLTALMQGLFGESLPAAFARRGDVVLVEIEGRESLAVCLGRQAAGPGETGLQFLPYEAWRASWRVGA